jgi:hypothetical protein
MEKLHLTEDQPGEVVPIRSDKVALSRGSWSHKSHDGGAGVIQGGDLVLSREQ